MYRVVVAVAACSLLGGCASNVWVRADGQNLKADPVLAHQLDMDKTMCHGETSKANMSGTVFGNNSLSQLNRTLDGVAVEKGCMANKGYVLVSEDEADAKAAAFKQIADEKARREAVAIQPPPRTLAKR